jgi:uncharacterized oxidoreductase
MQLQGNTVFITGGTSGIGRGLAEAFHQRGNQVIISGRREDRLKEICAHCSGMAYFVLDVTRVESIRAVAQRAIAKFPALNCVINNAGVQMHISAVHSLNDQDLQAEIDTNLLGPIRVTAAFLSHLEHRPDATLMNVSSGLAFVPMARFPVYCATKAAIHSWTLSLRRQLRESDVKVIEIIPPWVATELGGLSKPAPNTADRGPMPLDVFLRETLKELESGVDEVVVGDAKRLVGATSPETVGRVFGFMNT